MLASGHAVFTCPADSQNHSGVNYLHCNGTSSLGEATPDFPPPNTVLPGVAIGVRAARITDGLSCTVAFSERLVGDHDPKRYTASRDFAAIESTIAPGALAILPDTISMLCRTRVGPNAPHFSFNGDGWLFRRLGTSMYNHTLPPNSRIPDCGYGMMTGAYAARSLHRGGVFALYSDGATKFESESIDLTVWRALGTFSDGRITTF